MSTTVHFFDADRPDSDDVFPIYVYSDVIPRVGDAIHYHIDYYGHMYEGEEPGEIKGTVANVEIEYRKFKSDVVVMASVYLTGYKAIPPTKR